MRRLRCCLVVTWAVLLPVLAACSIDIRATDIVAGSRYPVDGATGAVAADVLAQATANETLLLNAYHDEWVRHGLRTGSAPGAPQLCLALSGGGIRSGAFAVGVMRGLDSVRAANGASILSAV